MPVSLSFVSSSMTLSISTFVHMMCHSSNSSLYFASIYRHTRDYITKFASESIGDGVLALSDKKGTVYSQYKVGKSARAKLSGEIDKVRNWDKYKRFFKFSGMKDANMGSRLRPADFLINEDGIIVDMYRAFDLPKQPCMPFDRIEAFMPEGKQCTCAKQDCVSPTCRKHWQEKNAKGIAT